MLMSRVTQAGAPLIEITVRDTVDDLRMVSTGDLPDEKVKLSSGKLVDLILWCLPDTTKRHHQWKGLLGRKHPNSITEPPTNGKCLHPDQNRLVTVRECACSQLSSLIKHHHNVVLSVL
ncbi:hypothetical protein POM88_027520 [Heracleum sosnowskyi]|uniref:Uncharacterized protein n=1 Tax=Heracleum sosnowskyi TaxID=360622 RepID=A0AAD8MPK9_9APIA|nr:hypothetical protein POM88_027520 [Heracleum sosnowskyi]